MTETPETLAQRLRTRNGRADGFGLGPVCDEAAAALEAQAAQIAELTAARENLEAEAKLFADKMAAQIEALRAALSFYADPSRYHGPNMPLTTRDEWSERVGLGAYRLDVTRDGGVIARAAMAAKEPK
jgi:hypothetical protein